MTSDQKRPPGVQVRDTASDAASLCGTKLGNYRVERVLGRGRMGVVYLAKDEALLRPAALKLLRWQASDHNGQNPEEWFLAEARSVARINHPSVVQIYGVARQGPHCYITMEYVAGGSVDVLVSTKGPFTAVRATELLVHCADALQAAHNAHIVHRDIKPENVLIAADGRAKLGDFGMALHMTRPRANEPARAGTPFYTAPEIWNGEAATPKTDLYALGATYYFMLTGRVPYEERDLPSLIAAHLNSPIPSINLADPQQVSGCMQIIRKCLAKSPKERYPNAKALAVEARELLRASTSLSAKAAHQERASAPQIGNRASPPPPAFSADSKNQWLRPSAALLRWSESQDSKAAAVVGEAGSGRTTQLQGLIARRAKTGTVLYYDGAFSAYGAGTFLKGNERETQLCGESPSVDGRRLEPDWEKVVAECGSTAVLFILDCPGKCRKAFSELIAALTQRRPDGNWKVVVADSIETVSEWAEVQKNSPELGMFIHELPRLTLPQSYAYVAERLHDTITSGPTRIISPDAMLLMAYFGMGNPTRINRLVDDLLEEATILPCKVLTSWEVWEMQFRRPEALPPGSNTPSAPRPENWPTPTVLELLNQCRRQCGLPARR